MNVFSILIQLMGGLGLFIYGMKLMGDGLENAAGEGLKKILEKVTSNRVMAVLIGASITAVIQSSSATTVMVVGFVNAGLMTLAQSAGVIMGANIGTTITAQLVAFKLDSVAPIFVFLGTILVMFSKAKQRKEIGNIILGFGILFTGMGFMSSSMAPLASSPTFSSVLIAVGDNWLIGILSGLTITAILQSSSATTGILIALASTGTITIDIALPIVFGCNIGTCITAILASIGTNRTAHKAALIHLIFNIVGTIIFIPFMGLLAQFVQNTSPSDVSRQIANAHTVFNIVNTSLLLPFSNYIIKFINKIVPDDPEIEIMGPKFIDDRVLETPVIAVGQVFKETIRMANKAKLNVELATNAFINDDKELIDKVYENEKIIDSLEECITNYLVKLSKCELSDKEREIVSSAFHVVIDIERIGDHAENIVELTSEKINKKLYYSTDAMNEIKEIYNLTMNGLTTAIDCYISKDLAKIPEVLALEDKVDAFQRSYREKHIERLSLGQCNAFSGAIFLDLVNAYERISDHAINITENITGDNI